MHQREDDLLFWTMTAGLSADAAASLSGVTPRTYRRYERGHQRPPVAVRRLILAHATGIPLEGWDGWRFLHGGPDQGKLRSPEGDTFGPGDLRAMPYREELLRELQKQLRRHRQYVLF